MIWDVKRINRMLGAVTAGVAKKDFRFESAEERDYWDVLTLEVRQIKKDGNIVHIPNE